MSAVVITTPRLVLRATEPRDRAAMQAQLADREVMQYLLPVPDDAAYDALVERLEGYTRDYGYIFWTVERRTDGAVIGTCGLKPGAPDTPIAGAVEIGWRFARETWGRALRVKLRKRRFVAAVALHSAMCRLRPEPDRLTGFYLAMSGGGALGGVFAALVASLVFDWTYEYPLLILLAGLLVPQDYLLELVRRL